MLFCPLLIGCEKCQPKIKEDSFQIKTETQTQGRMALIFVIYVYIKVSTFIYGDIGTQTQRYGYRKTNCANRDLTKQIDHC